MAGNKGSSLSNNWQDKITSKIRNCLQSASYKIREVEGSCMATENKHNVRGGPSGDDDPAINDNDTGSLEWHTPCEEIVEDDNDRLVTSPNGPRVYRAVYPYSAVSVDELSLKVGDVIVVVQQNTSDRGWWLGEHQPTGRTGLFPANYVEILNRSRGKKALSQNSSSSSDNRPPIRPGRLTAIEQELQALSAKLLSTPTQEQVNNLEAEVDRLKRSTAVIGSTVSSPVVCQETPIALQQQKTISVPIEVEKLYRSDQKENYAPVEKEHKKALPAVVKAVTGAPKAASATKPGPVRVPSCFTSGSSSASKVSSSSASKSHKPEPTLNKDKEQVERNAVTPVNQIGSMEKPQSASKSSYKPAGFGHSLLSGRSSTSPASTYAVAVRVNAVTPLSGIGNNSTLNAGDVASPVVARSTETPSLADENQSKSERKAGVKTAEKLKRRSINHYSKKCQRNFSKLCNFYEELADTQRMGLVAERLECSTTSPSSLSTSVATGTEETTMQPNNNTALFGATRNDSSHNKSKDNPFNNKSFESTAAVVTKSPGGKRFPAFYTSPNKPRDANNPTVSSVLMAKKLDKAATIASSTQSPSIKDVRRPPLRSTKLTKMTTVMSTPQPVKVDKSVKMRHPRCSSAAADLDDASQRESVNDLRKRFEVMNVANTSITGTTNSQPQEKRSRQCHPNPATPTSSSGGRSRAARTRATPLGKKETNSKSGTPIESAFLQSKTGKDSGLGNYGGNDLSGIGTLRSCGGAGGLDSVASSAVDLFNIAQTSQAFASLDDSRSSPAFSSASSTTTSRTIIIDVGKSETLKHGNGKSNNTTKNSSKGVITSNDEIRCSSASMLNEAGIFDCSLTWTESSSESSGDHPERYNLVIQQQQQQHPMNQRSNGRVLEVDTVGAAV